MTTIFERVTNALNTLSPAVPFGLAPYKTTGELPDLYLAYQLVDGLPEVHADDAETERSYRVQVSIYQRSGLVGLPDVETALTAAGFQKAAERQLPQDRETGHYGIAKDFRYFD